MLQQGRTLENRFIIALLLIIYAIYIYFLNSMIPYLGDDYNYSIVYKGVEINSLYDLLYPQYIHYYHTNGRIFIHSLLQIMLVLSPDKWLFNVCNTVIWLLFIWVIIKIALPKENSRLIYWLLTIIGVRLFLPESYSLYYWAAGSFNYYWSFVIVGCFMLLYEKVKCGYRIPCYLLPLVFLYSFLAGWTHEALVVGVAFALLVDLVCDKRSRTSLSMVLIVGFMCGFAVMFLSPANYGRWERSSVDIVSHILKLVNLAMQFRFSWLLAALLLWGITRDRRRLYLSIYKRRMLFIVWLVNDAFCLFLGVADRAIFFVEVMALILLLSYLPHLYKCMQPRVQRVLTIVLLVLWVAYESIVGCEMYKLGDQIEESLQEYRSSTKEYMVVPDWEPVGLVSNNVLSMMEFGLKYNPYSEINTNHRMFRILPETTYRAIVDGELFEEQNRLEGELPFYTTDSILCAVMPCSDYFKEMNFDEFMTELLSGKCPDNFINGKFVYHFYPVSTDDPDLSLLGWLKRVLYPTSYPQEVEADNYYSINNTYPYIIEGEKYIILRKPEFRRIKSVEYHPAE